MHLWFARIGFPLIVVALAAAPCLADLRKLDARARIAYETLRGSVRLDRTRARAQSIDEQGRIDAFVTGKVRREELEAAGAIVRTSLAGVHTVSIPVWAVERVSDLQRVDGISGSVMLERELNNSVPAIGVSNARGPGPIFAGLNGQGVIIGTLDGGLDYDHFDFRKQDGHTRFLSIWDQEHAVGDPPGGFGYGTEFSPADIDAGLPNITDYGGHGTFVLGVAAGDGSATGGGVPPYTYAGVAPRADLIFVNTNFSSTRMVDGVSYIFQRAAALGKPAIVNISGGTQFGPHDGTSAFESALAGLSGPGHLITKSAGNVRRELRHAEAVVGEGDSLITFDCRGATPGLTIHLEGYYDGTENLSMWVTTPNGEVVGPVMRGNQISPYPGQSTSGGYVWLANGLNATTSGAYQVTLQINTDVGQALDGTWGLHFEGVSLGAKNGEIDIWKGFNTEGSDLQFSIGESAQELLSEPGNSTGVITVAAWTTRSSWTDCAGNEGVAFPNFTGLGQLASFSSPGPTRDGRNKPEITAPGTAIISTASSDAFSYCPGGPSQMIGDGLQHHVDEGTSFSAPHVAGVLALWMQKVGPVTQAQAVSFLSSRAIVDADTGPAWNPDWGAGKLNLGDLTDPLITVSFPNGGETYTLGNPFGIGWSARDLSGVPTVDVYLSRHGYGGPYEPLALGTPNDSAMTWIVTGPASDSAVVRIIGADAWGNSSRDSSNAFFTIAPGPPPSAVGDRELSAIALSRPSPNPARGPIEVTFALPAAGHARLTVLDVQGRTVASLWDGALPAGEHRIRWDGRAGGARAPLGLYFLRLDALGERRTQRLAIAR